MVAFFISKSYLQKSILRFTGHYNGRLAQLGEQLPYKQRVGSSILSSPKPFFFYLHFYSISLTHSEKQKDRLAVGIHEL